MVIEDDHTLMLAGSSGLAVGLLVGMAAGAALGVAVGVVVGLSVVGWSCWPTGARTWRDAVHDFGVYMALLGVLGVVVGGGYLVLGGGVR